MAGWVPLEPTAPAASGDLDIDRIAQEEGADPLLVRAVMGAESGGRDGLVSKDGARGRMQIIPDTFKRFAKEGESIDDPVANIRAGSRYLKFLAQRLGNDPFLVGAAYLSGEGNVDRFGIKDDKRADSLGTTPSKHGRSIAERYKALSGGQAAPAQAAMERPALPSDSMYMPGAGKPAAPKPADDSEVVRGFLRGVKGTDQKSAGAALEMLGHRLGFPEAVKIGQRIQSMGDEEWQKYAPAVQSVFDVDSLDSFRKWAAGAIGEAAGTSLPSIAGGAAGAGAGMLTGSPFAVVGLGAAGAALPSYAMNAADVYSSAKEDPEIRRMLADGRLTENKLVDVAAIAGIPMAVLDTLSLGKATGVIGKSAKGQLAGRIIRHLLEAGVTEGFTEGMQEIVSQFAQVYLGGDKTFEQRVRSIIENVAAGTVGGVGLGGMGAIREGFRGGKEPPPEPPKPGTAPAAGTPPAGKGGWVPLDAEEVLSGAPRETPAPDSEAGGQPPAPPSGWKKGTESWAEPAPAESAPFRSNREQPEPAPFRSNRAQAALDPAAPPQEPAAPTTPAAEPPQPPAEPGPSQDLRALFEQRYGEQPVPATPATPATPEPALSTPLPEAMADVTYQAQGKDGPLYTQVRALTQALFDEFIAPGLRTPMGFEEYRGKYPGITHLAFTSTDQQNWKPAKPFVGRGDKLMPPGAEIVQAQPTPAPAPQPDATPPVVEGPAKQPVTADALAQPEATPPEAPVAPDVKDGTPPRNDDVPSLTADDQAQDKSLPMQARDLYNAGHLTREEWEKVQALQIGARNGSTPLVKAVTDAMEIINLGREREAAKTKVDPEAKSAEQAPEPDETQTPEPEKRKSAQQNSEFDAALEAAQKRLDGINATLTVDTNMGGDRFLRASMDGKEMPSITGIGATVNGIEEAERLLRRMHERAKKTAEPEAPKKDGKWTKVGKNKDGKPLYQDENGVRSVVVDGIRITETVSVAPTRNGVRASVDPDRRDSRFKTVEELEPPKADDSAKAKAAQDLNDALADLADIFGKDFKANITPEQEQKLLPVLTRVMDAAFRLGYYKFKEAARFVLKTIREKLGKDAAAAISLDHLQGAYIAMSGKYEGGDSKKAVIAVESLQELEEGQDDGRSQGGAQQQDGSGVVPPVGPGGSAADSGRGGPGQRGDPAPADAGVGAGATGTGGSAGRPAGGSGDRPDAEDGSRGSREPQGGNVPDGRPGAGGEGLAATQQPVAPPKQPTLGNYHISDPEQLIGGSPRVRFERNKAAIEALRAIQDENRDATPEERDILARYIGWGSFGQELFKGSWDYPQPKEGWEAADKWLRAHLGQAEWESAQRSIINAHYTDPPTVQTMWNMVERMGFSGGRILEPSIGIGNFFGMMPREIMARSQLTGIELDSLTGSMAQLLYPDANIQIKGYQDSKTADGFYDLVIGNWPFAAQGPADRRYRLIGPSLHDYFFLKAVDQVRPGGLVIGITSSGTMDKSGKLARLELAKKADLVAAFRLPSGAFEKYAGTSVVTDIIVLQKRAEPNLDAAKAGWIDVQEVPTPAGPEIRVNEYFVTHPDNVLGRLNWGHGTTQGRAGMIVDRPADLMQRLEHLPQRLPEGIYTTRPKSKSINYVTNNTKDRENSITVANAGRLFVVRGEHMAPLHEIHDYRLKDARKTASRERQIKALVEMRRAYGALIDAQRDGAADTEAKRTTLREAYERFVDEYGPIADSEGLAIFRKVQDPFFPSLASLEIKGKDGHEPARILYEQTMRQRRRMEKPSIRDAFVIARNESIDVNVARIAELSGASEDAVIKDLTEAGVLFKTPEGVYQAGDVYLSGNVRRKLREAQEAKGQGQDMDANIKALESVLPPNVAYFNIEAKLGAPWVGVPHYKQFVTDLLNLDEKQRDAAKIEFRLGSWRVDLPDAANMKAEARAVWGIAQVTFDRLLQGAFNNTPVTVYGRDSKGDRVVDEANTKLANEKVARLREEFSTWVWKNVDRRFTLEAEYNEVMNAEATPKFDGSFLTLEGMALQRGDSQFNLRSHQINAIWRGLVNRRGLYAHEVGTGKTYTMAGLAVESRRYGVARKPLILAHNANSASVAREFQEMYPAAKVLYLGGMSKEDLPVALRQIANDDWDAIVVPHSKIGQFGLSKDTLMKMAADEIAAMEQAAMEAASAKGIRLTVEDMDAMRDPDSKVGHKVRDATAKELVKARNAIIGRIEDMAMRASAENAIPFEELGIDMLVVDEAHNFGKPPLATKMKLRGLNKSTSNRSLSMWFLASYIRSVNGGNGVHLFTGTPITNTLNEIFNHQRYVAEQTMTRDGVKDWDSWFNTFADSSTDVELGAAGQFEPVTRLAAFVNVAELRRMIGTYTDIVFADDMPEFAPRTTASGKTLKSPDLSPEEKEELLNGRTEKSIGRPYKRIVNDVGQMSPEQESILKKLQALAQEFKNAGGKRRREIMATGHPASPVLVETNAANAGLDARLYDKDLPDHPDSKVARATRNIMKHYEEHPQATQVVFVERGYSDVSVRVKTAKDGTKTKTKVEKFNLINDLIEKLVTAGIPREQIVVVDGGVSAERKKQVADAMNRAEVRVVIGMTETLGVGVNMQQNLRAMHHLDAPWRPGDLEQRNGRGHRQGNQWNTVLEYRYITDRIDGRRWQVLAIKDQFIKKFLKADASVRVIEGDAASMDEEGEGSDILATLSEAAGDPRILLLNKYKQDVEKLENRKRNHELGRQEASWRLNKVKVEIATNEALLVKMEADAKMVEKARQGEFSAVVAGKKYDNRKDFDAALKEFIERKAAPDATKPTELGQVYGFRLLMHWRSASSNPWYEIVGDAHHEVGTTAASIEGKMRGITKHAETLANKIVESKRSVTSLEEAIRSPFPREADLAKKVALYRQVQADLDLNPEPPPAWLRQGSPVGIDVWVGGKPYKVEGHQYAQEGYFIVVATEEGARRVSYLKATDENGLPLYEPKEFVAPAKRARPLKTGDHVIRMDGSRWTVAANPVEDDRKNLVVKIENPEDGAKEMVQVSELTRDETAKPGEQIADLETAPSSGDYSVKPTSLADFWRGYASKDEAFRWKDSAAKDPATIAADYDAAKFGFDLEEMRGREGDRMLVISAKDRDGRYGWFAQAYQEDASSQVVRISINSTKEFDRGVDGALAYQMAMTWAINNGFKVKPEQILLTVNRLRRTEAMISMMLKYGQQAGVIEPHPEQYLGFLSDADWAEAANGTQDRGVMPPEITEKLKRLQNMLWFNPSSAVSPEMAEMRFRANLEGLLAASALLAERRVPALKSLRIQEDGSIVGGNKPALGPLGVDSAPAQTGVGTTTGRRAVATRQLLQGALQERADLVRELARSQSVSDSGQRAMLLALRSPWPVQGAQAQALAKALGANQLYSPGRARGGLKAADVEGAIAPIRRPARSLPPVAVVQSVKELPAEIQQDIRDQGIAPRGVFHEGRIYLVAQNLDSEGEARFVLLHEAAHFGLQTVFGSELVPVLMKMYRDHKTIREAADMMRATRSGLTVAKSVEEVLADMAGTGQHAGLVQKFIHLLKNLARRLGWDLAMTDADVLAILSRAQGAWQRDRSKFSHLYAASFSLRDKGSRVLADLLSREKDLSQRTTEAYESGAKDADDLDAQLAEVRAQIESVYAEMQEDEETWDAQDSLDVQLVNAYVAYQRGGWGALPDRESALANMRGALSDFGANDAALSDEQVLDAAKDAHDAAMNRRARRSNRDATLTDAFRRWFGDSKVVDADGNPLPVYRGHNVGTGRNQNTFYTDNPEVASGYATSRGRAQYELKVGDAVYWFETYGEARQAQHGNGGVIRKVVNAPTVQKDFLSLQNPLIVDAAGAQWHLIRNPYADPAHVAEYESRLAAVKGLKTVNSEPYTVEEQRRDILREFYPLVFVDTNMLARAARKNGHDGLIIRNVYDVAGPRQEDARLKSTVFVAFSPEQIKSAIGNRGTFDPTSPNISYSNRSTSVPVLRSGYKATAQRAIAWLDTKMDPIAALPGAKQYLTQRYEALGRIARVDEIAKNLKEVFYTASSTDKQAVYAFLTTRDARPDGIASEAVRRMAVQTKGYIESVGDALVERGMLSPEAREAHRGAYLPRLYLKHLLSDGDWKLLGAGKKPSDMGYLKQRKDLPEEYRKVILGEITDPAFLSGIAIAKPMRDMALLDFLAQISGNVDWVLPRSTMIWRGKRVTVHWAKEEARRLMKQARHMDEPQATRAKQIAAELDERADEYLEDIQGEHADFRQLPNTARYGRMRGLYVRKEIYDDLMGVNDFLPVEPGWFQSVFGFGGVGSKITGIWKAGKVALNPPAQVRNFVSNMVLLQLSGVSLPKVPLRVMQAWREIANGGPHWEIAKKYGVTESTFTAQEIWRMKRDLLELEHSSGLLDSWGRFKLMVAAVMDFAGDKYQLMEALGKTAKIIDEMAKGRSAADAAMEAQKWLFDYSLVPKGVRYARSAPIGIPFLTFFWKAVPRLAEVAVQHPQRFLPWVALAYGLPAMVASQFDVDDDDLEKLKKALPEWLQERGHAYLLPWKDEGGRWQVIDLGYFFPWTTVTEPMRNLADGELGKTMQGLGLFSGPITDLLVAVKTGKDSFTGRDIYQPGDPPQRQFLSIVNYLWSMAMPPILTDNGATGHALRSVTGQTNRFGDPLSTPGQAALRAFGVNLYALEPKHTRVTNIILLQREINDTRLRLVKRLQDRGLTPEKRQEIVDEYAAEIQKRADKLRKYLEESKIHPNLEAAQ